MKSFPLFFFCQEKRDAELRPTEMRYMYAFLL